MLKRLDFLIKLVEGGDVVVNRFFGLIFEGYQLLEGVALTQHRNILKIRLKGTPDIACRFAIPDQLEFGFNNGGYEDTHGIAVHDFPCCDGFWAVILIQWVCFASDKVVQSFPEFNLAFEAPLFVRSPGKGVDGTYDSVQCGVGRHGEITSENSSVEKIPSLLSATVLDLYPRYL